VFSIQPNKIVAFNNLWPSNLIQDLYFANHVLETCTPFYQMKNSKIDQIEKISKLDGNTLNIQDLYFASHKLDKIIKYTDEMKDKEYFYSSVTRSLLITYLISGTLVCIVFSNFTMHVVQDLKKTVNPLWKVQ
jgi:hypothetical protein